MAKEPVKANSEKAEGSSPSADTLPNDPRQECGIVMPISGSASHDASHWADVQELIHRAIRMADLEPKNVWAGSAIDRITPRILGNLFAVPIAVCDISDLNPNVMLELGMRLTSKKPTIVIAEVGSTIPFDIRDFEAIFYPGDLNILGMEKFFNELKEHLLAKLSAFNRNEYEPFLKDIAVEFLEPQGRAVPFEKLVEGRLDSIAARIEEISSNKDATSPRGRLPLRRLKVPPPGSIIITLDEGPEKNTEALKTITGKTTYIGMISEDETIYLPFGGKVSLSAVNKVEEALRDAGISATVTFN